MEHLIFSPRPKENSESDMIAMGFKISENFYIEEVVKLVKAWYTSGGYIALTMRIALQPLA